MADDEQPVLHRSSDKVVERGQQNLDKWLRRRQLRVARKGQRRNLEPKPPRNKGWTRDSYEYWDDLDHEQRERIMPLDEGHRRRLIEQAAFKRSTSGSEPAESRATRLQGQSATVVSVSSGLCTVERDGVSIQCRLRSRLTAKESPYTNAVAVGDAVVVQDDGADGGII